MNYRIYIIFFSLLTSVLFFSCYSVPDPAGISEDLSAPELIQKAQEASDRNRYRTSLVYYDVVLDRFYYDMEYVCAAEYEIAFISYKQKRYEEARSGFRSLLLRYERPDGELLPQQFKILSNLVLAKIDEIEERNNRW